MLLSGCQAFDTVDIVAAPGQAVSLNELLRLSKREFHQTITVFYQDNWKQVEYFAGHFSLLAARWREQPAPAGLEQPFRTHTADFAAATDELRQATKQKDVMKTTVALRRVAASLAALETLVPPTEPSIGTR